MIGMELWHVRGGRCVLRQLPVGAPPRAVVDYWNGAKNRQVLWSDLRVDRSSTAQISLPAVPEKRTPPKSDPTPDWTAARKAILALRLGQATDAAAKLISIETEEVEAAFGRLMDRIEARQPSYIVIEGPWGTGKTHALALLQGIARERKFALASLVLDGVATTLSKPNDLLREIVRSVSFPKDTGEDDLLDVVIEYARGQSAYLFKENGLTLLADALSGIPVEATNDPDTLETVEAYLAGEVSVAQIRRELAKKFAGASNLVSLKASRLDERPNRFATLLAEWARACRALHSHGLVVVLDELDVEIAFARSPADRQHRDHVLAELAALANSAAPLAVVFAVAPGAEIPGFANPTEYLAKQLGSSCETVVVPELKPKNLMRVAERLVKLYGEAFPGNSLPERATWEPVASEIIHQGVQSPVGVIPRRFIRSFLEYLDAECFAKTA